jgi:4'-phosphopantetheinyl transferase
LPLEPAAVRVVSSTLDVAAERLAELQASLSDDERARAERFVLERHRRRFVAARGTLRELLARELGERPRALRFEYGPHGKPRLRGAELGFNASHSQDLALYALARGRELGVDVEALREDVDHAAIAARFFSPSEREALRGTPADARAGAFFSIWTRKEAFVKLLGGGLAIPLDSFDVSLGEPAVLLRLPERAGAASLATLPAPPGYRAALAYSGGPAGIDARML